MAVKETRERSLWGWESCVLHLDRININIFVVMMFYNFIRCHPCGDEGDEGAGPWITSVLFMQLQLRVSLQLAQNQKFN